MVLSQAMYLAVRYHECQYKRVDGKEMDKAMNCSKDTVTRKTLTVEKSTNLQMDVESSKFFLPKFCALKFSVLHVL